MTFLVDRQVDNQRTRSTHPKDQGWAEAPKKIFDLNVKLIKISCYLARSAEFHETVFFNNVRLRWTWLRLRTKRVIRYEFDCAVRGIKSDTFSTSTHFPWAT